MEKSFGLCVFAQLMGHVSRFQFQTCVARYEGEYKTSRFSCWDPYLCMAFAQLTYRESLRDIEMLDGRSNERSPTTTFERARTFERPAKRRVVTPTVAKPEL